MLDGIKDGIVEWIIDLYTSFFGGVGDLFVLAKAPPDTWHGGGLWSIIIDFSHNAVMPVAMTLVSFFLLMELLNMLNKQDDKSNDSIYLIVQILVKVSIAQLIMQNIDLMILAIFQLSSFIVNNGGTLMSNDGTFTADTSALADGLDKSNIVTLLSLMVIGMILSLAQSICFIIAELVINLRFIEIYVFTALAPLAFATLMSSEYSSIGKNFFKRMAALALQVVFICIVLYMYVFLLESETLAALASDPLAALMAGFGYTLLMVISLFQTGGWAKSLTTAN